MLRISFEFVGGPNDGKALHGSLGDASDAERYYLFTNHGHVGQRFKVASDFAVEALVQEHSGEAGQRHHYRTHYYVVKERLEEEEEVLVRAEYVEKETDSSANKLLPEQLKVGSVEVESNEDKIRRYLKQAATVMDHSYGYYWPADEHEGGDSTEQNVLIHFAYVLLNERFSVFSKAQHPDRTLEAIDLLGVSPGQDWFLACQFMRLNGSEQLSEMLQGVQRLITFWLNTRLTIEACRQHIDRVASHCGEGYGLVAALHWVSEDNPATELLDLWTGKEEPSRESEFVRDLGKAGATFAAPISIRHYAGRGRYCLLPIFLRIPNKSE